MPENPKKQGFYGHLFAVRVQLSILEKSQKKLRFFEKKY